MVVINIYVILVYDISIEDNGQRRWRYVFKECKKYLNHIQNSVFEGELSKSQLFKLKKFMKENIRKDIDSVVFFEGRNKSWISMTVYGCDNNEYDNFI